MRGFTYTYYGLLFPNGILKFKTKTSKDAFARASAKTSIYLFRIDDCIKQVESYSITYKEWLRELNGLPQELHEAAQNIIDKETQK